MGAHEIEDLWMRMCVSKIDQVLPSNTELDAFKLRDSDSRKFRRKPSRTPNTSTQHALSSEAEATTLAPIKRDDYQSKAIQELKSRPRMLYIVLFLLGAKKQLLGKITSYTVLTLVFDIKKGGEGSVTFITVSSSNTMS